MRAAPPSLRPDESRERLATAAAPVLGFASLDVDSLLANCHADVTHILSSRSGVLRGALMIPHPRLSA